MTDYFFSNEEHFKQTLANMIADGKENFHVVADFDRTLTRASVNGEKSSTVIAQIRNGNYLTPDYAPKAHALFDHYNAIEIDPNYPRDEKIKKMDERWVKHYDLIIESGLTKQIIDEIVSKKTLQFREGSQTFFDILKGNNIPLVVISASVGDMIRVYLSQEGRLSENIHIVSNLFEFDDEGKTIRIKKPIVHCMNKSEVILDQFDFFDKVKERKNVLLLGDSLDDVDMVEGFDYKNLIKIGFLNDDTPENRESFKEKYDMIILNDGPMDEVNKLLKDILQ